MSVPSCLGWLAVCCFLMVSTGAAAPAKDLKYAALLVWATSADQPPDSKLKPVEGEILKRLRKLPLKWKNYYEVNRERFTVPRGEAREVTLSDKCKIEVKDVDGIRNIEVSLIGKGEPVLKRTQSLPKGEMLILGGDAPDETGWLVVLKRIE
jgi:hypothetical protein